MGMVVRTNYSVERNKALEQEQCRLGKFREIGFRLQTTSADDALDWRSARR